MNHQIQLAKYRILIVADNAETSNTLQSHLIREGYSVEIVASGHAMLAAWERWIPNLILLDMALSDSRALEVCNQLRTEHAGRCIPAIFLCGIHDGTVHPLEIKQADDYINKPLNIEELKRRIRWALERSSQLGQSHTGRNFGYSRI